MMDYTWTKNTPLDTVNILSIYKIPEPKSISAGQSFNHVTILILMKPSPNQQRLLDRVEEDREEIIAFLRGFLQTPSPNPPGDTRKATKYITDYLDSKNIKYKVVGPDPEKPNIVSTVSAENPGRHLILNGHIDVFPVDNPKGWSHKPWSGEQVDGKIYGRGACDMKRAICLPFVLFSR